MIERFLETEIRRRLGQGKVIVLVGARQVGKTTLTKRLLTAYDPQKVLTYSGDNLEAQKLSQLESPQIKALVSGIDCLLIDEAHKIGRIGDITKSLVDEYGTALQIILTGSATINLIDSTTEPLTGRKRVFELYPISLSELNLPAHQLSGHLKDILRFGLYPEVVNESTPSAKQDALLELAQSSIYRDVLDVTGLRASSDLVALLRYLATQIGQTLSINEASTKLSIDRRTIDRYIELLTKSFIIFPLFPYSHQGSISRAYKIYFWDVGIRNALVEDLSDPDLRADKDALWQNFCLAEYFKNSHYQRKMAQYYFWRSYDGQEVNLFAISQDQRLAYQFNYEAKKSRSSQALGALQPTQTIQVTLADLHQQAFLTRPPQGLQIS